MSYQSRLEPSYQSSCPTKVRICAQATIFSLAQIAAVTIALQKADDPTIAYPHILRPQDQAEVRS